MVDDILSYNCAIAIASNGDSGSPYILGDTFMRNFYVTFDFKKNNMEIATSVNAPSGVTITEVIWPQIVGWCCFILIVLACAVCLYKSCC